ncbi:MAG: hypothetical protein WBW73_31815, partial [Rhodoplanes sp.]
KRFDINHRHKISKASVGCINIPILFLRSFPHSDSIVSHRVLSPTRRQVEEVRKRVERARNPIPFRDAWVDHFVSDKFGAATTHWSKLEDRVRRGVGNPCPLVLIGLPASIVTFGENPTVLHELLVEE